MSTCLVIRDSRVEELEGYSLEQVEDLLSEAAETGTVTMVDEEELLQYNYLFDDKRIDWGFR